MSTNSPFILPDKRLKILAVDDDPSVLDLFSLILGKDYTVLSATNGHEAKKIAEQQNFQIVLLDMGLPDCNGLELLSFFKETDADIEVIVVTAMQSIKLAVEATRQGAYDYLKKDFIPEELSNIVSRAMEKYLRRRKIISFESQQDCLLSEDFIIGYTPKMKKVFDVVEKAAKVRANILITGESGTGKEIIARRIHALSENPHSPFISVNMTAVPAELMESTLFGHEKGAFTGAHRLHYGKFELASGGTLFLDEIGELRIDLQAKLLRALQEQTIERVGAIKPISVDVRVIAATNVDLEALVKAGKFRDDLFYRLNVVRVHLPPLRERLEDIPDLVRYFIKKYNQKFKRNVSEISELVLSVLTNYSWPGNIRELENLVERLIVLAEKPVITEGDIPVEYLVSDFDALRKRSPSGDVLAQATEAFERSFILRIMEQNDWNQTKTAEQLGIHRKTLEYKIKKYEIRPIIVQKRPFYLNRA